MSMQTSVLYVCKSTVRFSPLSKIIFPIILENSVELIGNFLSALLTLTLKLVFDNLKLLKYFSIFSTLVSISSATLNE